MGGKTSFLRGLRGVWRAATPFSPGRLVGFWVSIRLWKEISGSTNPSRIERCGRFKACNHLQSKKEQEFYLRFISKFSIIVIVDDFPLFSPGNSKVPRSPGRASDFESRFCDSELRGVKDPNRHSEDVLQQQSRPVEMELWGVPSWGIPPGGWFIGKSQGWWLGVPPFQGKPHLFVVY